MYFSKLVVCILKNMPKTCRMYDLAAPIKVKNLEKLSYLSMKSEKYASKLSYVYLKNKKSCRIYE